MDEQSIILEGIRVPVIRPASAAELGNLVRNAAEALFPLGGRTMLGLGLPPSRPGIGVDLTALDGVIDYPARDMTITVQAGIRLARLQEVLRKEGQRLPVEVPCPDQATLGGSLAANVSGPRQLGFGTFRDYVIGITVINDEGHEAKAGGRVVKNVAGYDLCKLHIGALGTLGIISQVTLKLRPIPEESALVAIRCEPGEVEGLLDRLHSSRTRPVCVDVMNARAMRERPENAWAVTVGYEESSESVLWQVQQLIKELSGTRMHGIDALVGTAAEPLWRALSEFKREAEATLSFKANLLPHAVAGFCRVADGMDVPIQLQAHAESGIIVGHVDNELMAERAAKLLAQLQEAAAGVQGNVVVLQCPPAWKSALPIWGERRGDTALMRKVREKLDPRSMFNPGRFVV